MHLQRSPKAFKKVLRDLKFKEESRLFRQEYSEVFERLGETCCHSDSCKRPPDNSCLKNSLISKKQKTKTNKQKTKQNNKQTCRIVDFAVPADQKIKLKESEKKDKYLELARELKKL